MENSPSIGVIDDKPAQVRQSFRFWRIRKWKVVYETDGSDLRRGGCSIVTLLAYAIAVVP